MSICIRQATPDDAPAVGNLVARLLSELAPDKAIDGPAIERQAAFLLPLADRVWGFLAIDGEESVGLLMLNECAAIYAGGLFGEITELFVDPAYRSRGVAPMLVAAATDFGAERGWSRLEVGAPPQPAWSRTRAFYLREGFEETGPRLRRLIRDV